MITCYAAHLEGEWLRISIYYFCHYLSPGRGGGGEGSRRFLVVPDPPKALSYSTAASLLFILCKSRLVFLFPWKPCDPFQNYIPPRRWYKLEKGSNVKIHVFLSFRNHLPNNVDCLAQINAICWKVQAADQNRTLYPVVIFTIRRCGHIYAFYTILVGIFVQSRAPWPERRLHSAWRACFRCRGIFASDSLKIWA